MNYPMKIVIVAVAIIAAGSAVAANADLNQAGAAFAKRVIQAVGVKLKDADTARYKLPAPNDQFKETGGYCGCVNARNSYGGYVGYYPFWLQVPKDRTSKINPALVLIGSNSFEGSAAKMMCDEEGYHLDC
jgi:hypothetical protein